LVNLWKPPIIIIILLRFRHDTQFMIILWLYEYRLSSYRISITHSLANLVWRRGILNPRYFILLFHFWNLIDVESYLRFWFWFLLFWFLPLWIILFNLNWPVGSSDIFFVIFTFVLALITIIWTWVILKSVVSYFKFLVFFLLSLFHFLFLEVLYNLMIIFNQILKISHYRSHDYGVIIHHFSIELQIILRSPNYNCFDIFIIILNLRSIYDVFSDLSRCNDDLVLLESCKFHIKFINIKSIYCFETAVS
jgi:hypothetical protein